MTLKGLLDLPDFHVAEGSIDARGWPLLDASGEPVGRIVDFIVDTDALEARYLLVALDGLFREVVIALKEVDLDPRNRLARCRQATKQQIQQLPYFGGTSLKPEDEQRLYATFIPGTEREEAEASRFRERPTRILVLSMARREGETP